MFEVFTKEQIELLPLIKSFSKEFYLVGGTALAIQIHHRRSIDFDLFSRLDIRRKTIKRIIDSFNFSTEEVLYEAFDQLHLIVNSVKITFFNYPYDIKPTVDFEGIIKMPSLLDLAAMKAYALGGRAKWKDYIDLFFLLNNHFSLQEISNRSKEIFKTFFNEKLFREQLSYFDDIDYSERVDFISDQVDDYEIKNFLIKVATTQF